MVPFALSLIDHLPDGVEDRVREELDLLGIEVQVQPLSDAFSGARLSEQLRTLRALPEAAGKAPWAWISLDGDDVQLSLAFLGPRRAVVRVVEAPRGPGVATELALGARDILATVGPDPFVDQGAHTEGRLSVGAVAPFEGDALGVRPAVSVEALRGREVLVGGALVGQLNPRQGRIGARAVGRWGPGALAAGVDLTVLPWVTWVQPRVELGAEVARGALAAELRVAWAPVRDVVNLDNARVYDSGRIEASIWITRRQIWRR